GRLPARGRGQRRPVPDRPMRTDHGTDMGAGGITFAMLRDLDPASLAALAALAEADDELGRRCAALQHEVETEAAGQLVRSGWQGPAAEAVPAPLDRLDDAFELAELRHRATEAQLRTLHMRLSRLHAAALSIVEEARAGGLSVSGTGEVWDQQTEHAPVHA